jgi:hypothetical protein
MKPAGICGIVVLLGLALPAMAQPAPDGQRIDAYLEPAGEVYVGQQLRLTVHLETDTWFASAPRYPEIQIPGAIVLQPEAFAVNSTRREGGRTWTGQRQRYVIFPQRSGTLAIAPFQVTFSAAVDGQPGPPSSLSTPGVTTRVRMPPGGGELAAFVTATALTVRESWDREPADLVVGDALVRSITRRAEGTFALLLPPLAFPDLEKIASYPAQPRLEDRTNRGRYSGTRVDQVSYVLQQAGTFEIPSMAFHWFDLGSNRMRTETLPAVTLTVADNPSARTGQPATEQPPIRETLQERLTLALNWLRENLAWLTMAAALFWSLRWCWARFRGPLSRYIRQRRHQRQFGEPARFRTLLRAVRRNDQDGFVRAFWSWSDHLPNRSPPLTGAAVVNSDGPGSGSREMIRVWNEIARDRYRDKKSDGLPPRTAASLTRLRKRWIRGARPGDPESGDALNP